MSTLMNRGIVIAIIVSIILGSVIGFGLSYATFQPSINQLQEAYVSASLRDDKLNHFEDHNVKGTVINFGSVTALNITITVKWFKLGASFHQEIITIPSLEGREMKEVSFSYIFGGSADDFQYSISWS